MAGFAQDLATGLSPVTAKTLFLPSSNDLLLQPYLAQEAYNTLQTLGKETYYEEIEGPWGHLNGVYMLEQKAEVIKQFLGSE